jgi:hypothetical protein
VGLAPESKVRRRLVTRCATIETSPENPYTAKGIATSERSERAWRATFAEKDDDERDQQILYGLAAGATCEQLARNEREMRFCQMLKPGVDDLLQRGVAIDLQAVPR